MFLSLLFLGILFYSGRTAYHVWQYVRLDKQIKAEKIQWSVLSLGDEEFVPHGTYEFKAAGKSYQGETRWRDPYLNEWAAQEAVKNFIRSPPLVWYDAGSPEFSSLEKHFPVKEGVYTFILWILGLYFAGLGYYVQRRIQ